MNFVVIGTDHRFQNHEAGLEGLLAGWLGQQFCEPLKAIAEEYDDSIGNSIGQRLALDAQPKLSWYNLDMTTEEKRQAGILEEQEWRRASQPNRRVPSDEVREGAWVDKLTGSGSGTTLVICGFVHLESLVKKLREKGCAVDQRVYLETVSRSDP